jgi:uroporphyrin-III C-methyltransferase
MLFGRADEELRTLKDAGITVEVVPGITAALAGAASIGQSLTLRGISRSVAFVTLAQATENPGFGQPLANPSADTLVYYMGRKDAARIAQQLIEQSPNHGSNTPVQILEAVSTPRERRWSSTLSGLAAGKADQWFDTSSPALIMIGEALRADSNINNQSKVEPHSRAA